MTRMKWRHTLVLATVMLSIGGVVFAGSQLVDTLLGQGTVTIKSNVGYPGEILSVQNSASTEIFGVNNGTSSTLAKVSGDADTSLIGPLTVAATGTGTTYGAALTLDATADSFGGKYSLLATGPSASLGAGHLSLYKASYGFFADFDTSNNFTPGNTGALQSLGTTTYPWANGVFKGNLLAIADASASTTGSITARSLSSGGFGAGIVVDAATNGTGRKYAFYSTDASAGVGAGHFSIIDGTYGNYVLDIDTNHNLTTGSVSGGTIGTSALPWGVAYVSGINTTAPSSTGDVYPGVPYNNNNGRSTNPWYASFSQMYVGREQTIAAASTITLNPTSGEAIRIALSATAITTINGAAGQADQKLRVTIVQDSTGGRSISGWAAGTNGFALESLYFPSVNANTVDIIMFAWDATSSLWRETSRVQSTPNITSFPTAAYQGASTSLPNVNWNSVTYTNSWTNYGGVYSATAYFKDTIGQVHVRIATTNGTSNNNTIFTLPVGYRPAGQLLAGGINASAVFSAYQITAAGTVSLVGAGTGLFVPEITFMAGL